MIFEPVIFDHVILTIWLQFECIMFAEHEAVTSMKMCTVSQIATCTQCAVNLHSSHLLGGQGCPCGHMSELHTLPDGTNDFPLCLITIFAQMNLNAVSNDSPWSIVAGKVQCIGVVLKVNCGWTAICPTTDPIRVCPHYLYVTCMCAQYS